MPPQGSRCTYDQDRPLVRLCQFALGDQAGKRATRRTLRAARLTRQSGKRGMFSGLNLTCDKDRTRALSRGSRHTRATSDMDPPGPNRSISEYTSKERSAAARITHGALPKAVRPRGRTRGARSGCKMAESMHSPALPDRLALAFAGAILFLLTLPATAGQHESPASWLDRPLVNWNKAGEPVPSAPAGDEPISSVISRCKLTPPRSTMAERAIESAGWIPFWYFDQQLVREDVEIVGGMRGADGMCRPATYNLFVFVGGQFAGRLSRAFMTSQLDSSSGIVRIALPVVTTEFARYSSTDPLCCPSSRVTVRYRIDRTAGTVVVPVDIRNTRR